MSQNRQIAALAKAIAPALLAMLAQGGVALPVQEYAAPKPRARKAAKPKPPTPQWVIDRAKNSDARRKLAAEMRANGVEPTGEAWKAAKAAAGIK